MPPRMAERTSHDTSTTTSTWIRCAQSNRRDPGVGGCARLRGAHTRPARDDSAAARRARPARAGRNRNREDGGVCAADASPYREPRHRGRRRTTGSCSCRRASWRCRSRKPCTNTRAGAGRACCRSMAARRCRSRSVGSSAARTSSSRRPAVPSITSGAGR